MPRCVICRTAFSYTSFSGPAEPCDCGAEVTSDHELDMDPAVVREWRRRWKDTGTLDAPPPCTAEDEA